MRQKAIWRYYMAVFILVLPATAQAETIEGRVSQTMPGAMDVVIYDPQGRPYPNALRLQVDSRTELGGVRSLSELYPNDAISADIHQEESGVWHADRVILFQEMSVQPATKKPSPSLRDVLGNPVARGALVGAATGALSAEASGGKAGKGALIGAGVGAAAGLLEGIFNQKSTESDSQASY